MIEMERIEKRCPYLRRCYKEKSECYYDINFENCVYYNERLMKGLRWNIKK